MVEGLREGWRLLGRGRVGVKGRVGVNGGEGEVGGECWAGGGGQAYESCMCAVKANRGTAG